MLFTENLEEIIFNRHQHFQTDELIVLSGYVGPKPIERLQYLPFNSRIIYGMYGLDGIKRPLHNSLVTLQNRIENINIFYSNSPVHTKCYAWRNRGSIVHALVGSANFSKPGLTTPFREILAETTLDTFHPLNAYLERVLNNSQSCLEIGAGNIIEIIRNQDTCTMTLLMENGEVHNASGLNWGYMANGQPSKKRGINDACIPIKMEHVINYPELFPPKQHNPLVVDPRGRMQRHNDAIEMIWDDGLNMEGLLEGTQDYNGLEYPKQISSFPVKNQLGVYLRGRLGVPLGQPVRRFHLDRYGRTDISVSLLEEGVYKCDFSV